MEFRDLKSKYLLIKITFLVLLYLQFGTISGDAADQTSGLIPDEESKVGEDVIDEYPGSAKSRKLIEELMYSYNTLVLPRLTLTEPLTITVGLSLLAITTVSETENAIQTNVILHLNYTDFNIRWNTSFFPDVSSLQLSPERMWSPDIRVLNQFGEPYDTIDQTNNIVKANGSVAQNSPARLSTHCVMSIQEYPFQEHICEIKLGSFSYDITHVDLEIMKDGGVNLDDFTDSVNWNMIAFSAQRNEHHQDWSTEPLAGITYVLHIQRKGMPVLNSAYTANFVICSIILLSGLLSPSSCHKVPLGMFGIVLCVGAVLHFNPLCSNGEPPRLAMYFQRLLLVTITSLITNGLTLYFFQKQSSFPSWIKSLHAEKLVGMFGSCQVKEEESEEDWKDWQYFAIILDRFLFGFWSVFIIIFATVAFPSFSIHVS